MKHTPTIELTKERREQLLSEIKKFYSSERDETIGDLAALVILDFIMEKIAPEIYNQGVYDSYAYMKESTEDLLAIIR